VIENYQLFCHVKMTAFYDTAPCSLVETDRRFKGRALIMEAVNTPENSVDFFKTTRHSIPEGSHLHIFRRENPKCRILSLVLITLNTYVFIFS
jgi:hypothetical protein